MNATTTAIAVPSKSKPKKRGKRGDGHLYRRPHSKYWWMKVPNNGRVIRESTHETDIKKAQQKLDAKLDEVGAARGGFTTLIGPEHKTVTVQALINALMADFELRKVRSLKSITSYLKTIESTFGHWKAVDLTKDAIDHYIADRVKKGHAPASINRSTQVLGQAIRGFLEEHRLPVPKIRRLPEENIREGFYSQTDIAKLIAALPEDLKDFTLWAAWTGWRKGEIASLAWSAVDRAAGEVRLSWRKSKNRQARSMALVGELAQIIERRWAERQITGRDGTVHLSPLVFHRGCTAAGQVIRVADFDKSFAAACRAAGLPYGRKGGHTFHDLRRTAARNLRRAGVSETVSMAVTGHVTASMFRRYSITDPDDIRQAMERVQAHIGSEPVEASNVIALKSARS
jgi:integrase